ncbi:MAG TPA: hypothetical protein VNU19_16950 [Candidatus Acidoferrum sp.]|nr:hypothetical protein [Candidatus Acidoferrum sp.]
MQRATVGIMDSAADKRIQARDAATRMLNGLTAGLAFGAIAGVGILGAVSAYTIPGNITASSAASASTSTSSSNTSSNSGTTSTGVQASPNPISSSSGSGVAVSGGS